MTDNEAIESRVLRDMRMLITDNPLPREQRPPITDIPRGMRTPTTEAGATLTLLADIYSEWRPDLPEGAFFEEIFAKMWQDKSTSGEDIERTLRAQLDSSPEGEIVLDQLGALLMVCAYCVQAIRTDIEGRRELAWTYAADAWFWYGSIIGAITKRDEGGNPLREQARKAALARHKEHRQLKAEVLDWMEKHGHEYPSKDAAAEAIAGKVVPLTFRTVRNHLKGPPKK